MPKYRVRADFYLQADDEAAAREKVDALLAAVPDDDVFVEIGQPKKTKYPIELQCIVCASTHHLGL